MLKNKKLWPLDCPWPDPRYPHWGEYDADDVTEREIQINWALADIIDAKKYYESVKNSPECIKQNSENYDPETGSIYWEDGVFDEEMWQDEFDEEMSKIKLFGCSAAYSIENLIGYDFADEHLLQQAFTRRSFAMEYGLSACSEELEFFGDAALSYVLTRTMAKQYGEFTLDESAAYYQCRFNEGEMSRIRAKFINKEYLAERASVLELIRFILYGSDDKETEHSKEDVVEAVIGAVAVDSDWNYDILEGVIDRLLLTHLECPDKYIERDMYELFNSWHQKHFSSMPEYEIHHLGDRYTCTLRFIVPENNKGIARDKRIDVEADTRSLARSRAADMAQAFLDFHGLWLNLADSGISPDSANSINQLQELYQKKYITEPVYNFRDDGNNWHCSCICDAFVSEGMAKSKTEAKKLAAYKMLLILFQSAGIGEENAAQK